MITKITKAYVRTYSDNNQTTGYVEWIDNKNKTGRTEGKPNGSHMKELFKRARREGVKVTKEKW
jgi:hypothetical protein